MAVKFNEIVLSLALASSLLTAPAWAQAPQNSEAATHAFGPSRPIQGRYIVVFTADVRQPAQEAANLLRGSKATLHHTFSHALKGFAATIPAAALPGLQNNPMVDYIEQDQTVSLNQVSSPQSAATWGLDRIDQTSLPLNSSYSFNGTGAGTTAFIIDTGIRADHAEFAGRVLPGYSAVADGNGTNDCNGHGTHVSGTVGGSTWGVAKGVNLVPVRVLDCAGSGSLSGVIAGIDWAAGSSLRPAVANLSLGSAKSSTVNAAVAGAYNKGLTLVVAAGNSSANACNYSPASEPTAITVGATTSADARAIVDAVDDPSTPSRVLVGDGDVGHPGGGPLGGQHVDIAAAGGQADQLEAVRVGRDDVQRLRADRPGTAEDQDLQTLVGHRTIVPRVGG